jgi:hypothetical protein
MFDSLADQMKADDRGQTSGKERLAFWSIVVVLSVVLFVGLYVGVRMLE